MAVINWMILGCELTSAAIACLLIVRYFLEIKFSGIRTWTAFKDWVKMGCPLTGSFFNIRQRENTRTVHFRQEAGIQLENQSIPVVSFVNPVHETVDETNKYL